MLDIIERAAEQVGGLKKLARGLGITHNAFYSWKRVPAERVLDIERLSGVPRWEMRPELYPPPEAQGGVAQDASHRPVASADGQQHAGDGVAS